MSTKILIVRDNEAQHAEAIDVAKSILRAEFLEASCFAETIIQLKKSSFRAVVCDYELPNGDALKLFAHFERIDFGETTFFVLDEFSRTFEYDREKMIVLQGQDEILELYDELEFIGIMPITEK